MQSYLDSSAKSYSLSIDQVSDWLSIELKLDTDWNVEEAAVLIFVDSYGFAAPLHSHDEVPIGGALDSH